MIMEEANEILKYLPRLYKDRSEQEYITFLWEAYESNYENEKYQFAFIGYHMLFMCFVYFNVWQIKNIRHEDFQKIKLGFGDDVGNATNPFMFSGENERKIFDLLKYLCAAHTDVKSLIGKYKKLVDERNGIAHANGTIPFSTVSYLERKIKDVLRYADEIQQYSRPLIEECFEGFLIESQNEETREYLDISDQIREVLIHRHYLSEKDLAYCLTFDISKLSDQPHFVEIRKIYKTLKEEYSED